MTDNFVLNALKSSFRLEISNSVIETNEGLVVMLADGSKALVKAKKIV